MATYLFGGVQRFWGVLKLSNQPRPEAAVQKEKKPYKIGLIPNIMLVLFWAAFFAIPMSLAYFLVASF